MKIELSIDRMKKIPDRAIIPIKILHILVLIIRG